MEATYETTAKPAEVVEHYRKLFEGAGLRFQPNGDGIGTSVRASASECDLLILIHPQGAGTFVDVNCAAKSAVGESSAAKPVEIIRGGPSSARPAVPTRPLPRPSRPALSAAEMQARHEQTVKELGIHPEYRDAPAPPLVWPSWLIHITGAALRTQQGVDQSKKSYLECRYTTTQPMSAIYTFYQDLLESHEYPVHSSQLGTGQTISGVTQNASGYVEGTHYPDGSPGPRTVIRVSFSRSYLNEPITVRMRITSYEFTAPKLRLKDPR